MPTENQRRAIRAALLQIAPINAATDPAYTYNRSRMFSQAVIHGDVNMACAYASHCKVLDVNQVRAVLTLILK
jgi:hypothetical protein